MSRFSPQISQFIPMTKEMDRVVRKAIKDEVCPTNWLDLVEEITVRVDVCDRVVVDIEVWGNSRGGSQDGLVDWREVYELDTPAPIDFGVWA